jgi:hypothetical protein
LINVEDDHRRDCPTRTRISRKFPRSHSTGHSLIQPGENIERYTLRFAGGGEEADRGEWEAEAVK